MGRLVCIAMGVLIGMMPVIAGQADNPTILYNAALVGVLVLVLGAFEMVISIAGRKERRSPVGHG